MADVKCLVLTESWRDDDAGRWRSRIKDVGIWRNKPGKCASIYNRAMNSATLQLKIASKLSGTGPTYWGHDYYEWRPLHNWERERCRKWVKQYLDR